MSLRSLYLLSLLAAGGSARAMSAGICRQSRRLHRLPHRAGRLNWREA